VKYYRHTITLREELAIKRRTDRAQAGFDLLIALFVCLSVVSISVMVLS
jgi:hypothetical protein